ncbi:MAG: Gx transporter family protein [Candidatus Howiella sp.]
MAKKTAYTGVMLALAMIFGYIESLLPLPAPVPGIKLGLANLIVLLLLYRDGAGVALSVNLARIFLTALLFGNLQSGLFSLCGGLLSFGVMLVAQKIRFLGVTGVSLCGGTAHMIGQLLAAAVVLQSGGLLYYVPFLIAAGAVSGFLIGLLARLLLPRMEGWRLY